MNKFITLIVLLALTVSFGNAQVETLWEKSKAADALPSWFSETANTERGFGFGTVGANDRIFVVSRNGGNNIQIVDATDGSDVGTLDVTGVSGGTFAISDADVSSDGVIMVCNLTTNAATSPFKVYSWANEGATPANVISYTGADAQRLGDKFTVVGSASDNTLKVYAAIASSDTVVVFTTADNGASFTASKVKLDNTMQSSPAVAPVELGDGSFYVNANGDNATHYLANGTAATTVPGGVLATGSNAMRFIKTPTAYFLVAFQYGTGNQNARIIDATMSAGTATTFGLTTSLGDNSNANGAGDVAVKDNGDGTFNVYAMATNNGFGAYKVTPANEIFLSEYIEGSSNNKALEIYNGTGADVALDNYQIAQSVNGNGWQYFHIFPEESVLENEDVWVILNNATDPAYFPEWRADEFLAYPSVVHHNGNDARAIIKVAAEYGDTLVVDVFGDPNSDQNFDVAGVSGAAQNHTIVRKGAITSGNSDWTSSTGTNADDSEWIVYDQNTFTYLGTHPGEAPELALVQVIHNAADLAADTVDIWLDDQPLLQNFGFRQASPYVPAPAGVEFDITVQPKGSSDTTNALWKKSYTLANGSIYVLIANGIVSPSGYDPATPFDIAVYDKGQQAAGGATNTDLLIYHGATDAPIVDVVAEGAGTIVDNLAYFNFTEDYLALPTADYKLIVTDSSGTVGVQRYLAPLATLNLDGGAAVVFASGFLDPSKNSNGPAFGVLAALPTGDVVALPLNEEPVKVTFRANTSRVFGIVDSTGGVDIRGALQNPGWTPLADPMMSDGGDYWSIEWEFGDSLVGTTIDYKYGGTVKNPVDLTVTSYWENDIPGADGAASSPNRQILVPYMDTVWPIQYVGHRSAPYTDDPDSIDVFFRINMSTLDGFDSASDTVFIAGSMPNIGWDPPHKPLTREGDSDYWNIATRIDPENSANFKYTRGSWDGREESQNRGISPINGDTTIQFVYYNNILPQGATGEDTVQVTFRVDMTRGISDKGFTPGDSLVVRWGYEGSSLRDDAAMTNEFGTDFYSVTGSAEKVTLGEKLIYQYYLIPEGRAEEREIYYDFNDPNQSTSERRKIVIPSPKPAEPFVISDVVASEVDDRRQPTFRNSSPLENDVLVTWTVDLRPAYYQVKLGGDTLEGIQNTQDIGPAELDSIFVWGVWMNGPAVGGWNNPIGLDWGPDLVLNLDKKLYDDGTNGDQTAGDSIYTRQVQYYSDPDSNDVVGQVYKFGIRGGDNEAGSGGFGNNHVANIDDSQPNFTIHTQFGSINPPFYSFWDFDNQVPTSVEDAEDAIVIRDPNLRENYPNPFNPTTTLTFELPKQMDVKLVVYDVLGRKVTELVSGIQKQGVHKVVWNGSDSHGHPVSSGVYFYRMTTDNFQRTMKMMLIR